MGICFGCYKAAEDTDSLAIEVMVQQLSEEFVSHYCSVAPDLFQEDFHTLWYAMDIYLREKCSDYVNLNGHVSAYNILNEAVTKVGGRIIANKVVTGIKLKRWVTKSNMHEISRSQGCQ